MLGTAERTVIPEHQNYQVRLSQFLKTRDITAEMEKNFVDVSFSVDGESFIGEIKVTRNLTIAQAFRAALGQLLEYSYLLFAKPPHLIMFLDQKLDIETASLLRANGTFQYLTGLPSFPDPQTLRRFLLNAPVHLREHLHRANDRLLQRFVHLPEHRSRLLFDLDSTVVTSFGHQEGAEVGYNPRYRGKRSYDPLLCVEANSSFLWDVELRR